MASGGCRGRSADDIQIQQNQIRRRDTLTESDLEIDFITPEEMTSFCDAGNEQTWLCCSEGSNPNSFVDLTEFLQIQSSTDDKERLYRTVIELESSKGGGIDTRTFTRPKKMSLYHPLPKVSEPHSISFQPSGEVNNRYSFLSKSPIRKDSSSLKDVTNSTFDTTLKKPHFLHRISNFDDFNLSEQTMISEISTPSFLSISDSDDGISENIPNVSVNSKYNESRMKRGKSVENKIHPTSQPQFQPACMSTPSTHSKYSSCGSSLDISNRLNLNSSSEAVNRTINLDHDDGSSDKAINSTPKSLHYSAPKTSIDRKMSDSGTVESFTAFDRVEKIASPKSSPKMSGLRRLSYNNTFRLSKADEPKHFKSVESGLDSTFEIPNRSPGKVGMDSIHIAESTYSSTGNIPRSLGDVHLAAQQQEYQLRDDTVVAPSVPVPTLKSPMKKVLSENCIFSSSDGGRLRVVPNHHGSVSNLASNNNNKDNNNQPTEFSSKLSSAGSKKNLVSGLPVSTRPSASKPRSRIPSRLPTRMPKLQPGPPKAAPDWTEGCY